MLTGRTRPGRPGHGGAPAVLAAGLLVWWADIRSRPGWFGTSAAAAVALGE